MTALHLDFRWESALHDVPEVRQTAGLLTIRLGGEIATRNEDEWSRTVRDDVRLSAYPLAVWLSANWWRLCHEPLPQSRPRNAWRMSHELAAAGHGFVWPRLLFAADGEGMHVWAAQTSRSAISPVRYLAESHQVVPVAEFERAVDEFVQSVLARLEASGLRGTDLAALWTELAEERADPAARAARRLEALLGFDPDDCPDDLLARFEAFGAANGKGALDEIAPLCAVADPKAALDDVIAVSRGASIEGRIEVAAAAPVAREPVAGLPAWERGHESARRFRSTLGLNGGPVTDEFLAGILGVPRERAFDPAVASRASLGLAVRDRARGTTRYHPRKRNKPGRRFEFARVLGDFLSMDRHESWIPVTDAGTSRQKFQRAFAAEFLCPIASLTTFLSGDFSPTAIDDAAEHFAVSERAIVSQLVNNHFLPPRLLEGDGGFPYVVSPS
jgi:hypothetical protein